ncbi:MAG: hypothetical protein JW994_08165, partial [Candidatus Omnitrophica bacterium]|nr:hypothetical protein [Candidatus Omnitrophota bacterium]
MENKEDKKPKSGGKQELLANLFKKASKRERLLFYLACFAMLVVLLDRIVLIPIMRNLKSIEDKIEQKKTIIKDGLAILAYENRITEDYDRV